MAPLRSWARRLTSAASDTSRWRRRRQAMASTRSLRTAASGRTATCSCSPTARLAGDNGCRSMATSIDAHVRWSSGTMHGNRMQTWLATEGPLPAWGTDLARRMVDAGIFHDLPDYLHLIHYKAGSGIPSHIDREIFQGVGVGLTLQSSRVMDFTHPRHPLVRVLLLPGDLYVISGEARHKWEHGISFQRVDRFHRRDLVRTDGMSASWRCMVPGAL